MQGAMLLGRSQQFRPVKAFQGYPFLEGLALSSGDAELDHAARRARPKPKGQESYAFLATSGYGVEASKRPIWNLRGNRLGPA
jgi:hypothetical protein